MLKQKSGNVVSISASLADQPIAGINDSVSMITGRWQPLDCSIHSLRLVLKELARGAAEASAAWCREHGARGRFPPFLFHDVAGGYRTFTCAISCPSSSTVWMAQARHGSKEWTVRSASSGFFASAMGLPTSDAS